MTTKHPDFGLHKKSFPNDVDVDRIVKAMKARSKLHFEPNHFGSPAEKRQSDVFTTPEGFPKNRKEAKMTFSCKSPGTLDVDDSNFVTGETNWGVATPLFADGEEPAENCDEVIYSKLAKLNEQNMKSQDVLKMSRTGAKSKAHTKSQLSSSFGRYSTFATIGCACILSIFIYIFMWIMDYYLVF